MSQVKLRSEVSSSATKVQTNADISCKKETEKEMDESSNAVEEDS